MGRVAVDFGVGEGAKRSVDIRSDLGQAASNAGQRQNQRNRRRREAEGQLVASLGRYSPLKRMRLARSLPSALLPLRAVPVFQRSSRPWHTSLLYPTCEWSRLIQNSL